MPEPLTAGAGRVRRTASQGVRFCALLAMVAAGCGRGKNAGAGGMPPNGGSGGATGAAGSGGAAGTAGTGTASGGAAGQATGSSDGACWTLPTVSRVRFVPMAGREAQMVGGRIVGSNESATNGFVDLATIASAPAAQQWTELAFANTTPYRWVKYYGAAGSYGAIAELELYAGGERLSGAGFGTAGSRNQSGTTFDRALDGDPSTFFEGPLANDDYVGLDLGANHVVAAPAFSPPAGPYSTPQAVTMSSATPGARIRYTADGSSPTAGTAYTAPVTVGSGSTVLKAIASADCMLDSDVTQGSFQIGSGTTITNSSLMLLGNSLTDTVDGRIDVIGRSGGITVDFHSYTVPGAGMMALWEDYRTNITPTLQSTRFDHLTVQPYPNLPCYAHGTGSDSDYANRFYALAKQRNPDTQLWIYQQWPKPMDFGDCLAAGANWTTEVWTPPIDPPRTWEDSVSNQLWYQEQVRQAVMDLNPGGKTVYVIPGGLALLNLKREVEAGRVPGVATGDFLHVYFTDDGNDDHLTLPGRWFIGLVFYACLFQKNPAGVDTSVAGGITAANAAKLEDVAWSTVTSYRYSGVSR